MLLMAQAPWWRGRAVPAALIALVGAAATPFASPPQATGLIVGRVVDAATGQPVPSATVRVLAPGTARSGPTRPTDALSDTSGGFFFARLPAGNYLIYAEKPGYIQGVWGQRRPGGAAARFPLADGERVAGVTITLWPWASVAGAVVDDRGRPLGNAIVFARQERPPGSAENRVERSARTGADGRYEIQDLTPGSYVVGVRTLTMNVVIPPTADRVAAGAVVADPSSMTIAVDPLGREATMVLGPARDVVNPANASTAYVSTYYGGAVSPATATPVVLAPGEQRAGVDIAMAARPTARVSGVVQGPDGPAGFAVLHLLPGDFPFHRPADIEEAIAIAVAGPTGAFAFRSAPAGSYVLDAYLPDGRAGEVRVSPVGLPQLAVPGSRGSRVAAWARVPIVIGDTDVADFPVVMRRGAVIAGTVSLEGARLEAGAPPRPVRVSLARTSSRNPATDPIALDPAGPVPFAIPGVGPGWYVVTATALPEGWDIGRVTIAGRDVTGMPVELGADDLDNVAVTLTREPTAISGRVLDDRGRPVRDATVVLFPTDRTRWTKPVPTATHVQSVRASGGVYELRGFGAGEYYVVAVDDAVMGDFPDPALLSRLATGATRVRVGTGQQVVQELHAGRVPRADPNVDLPLAEGPVDDDAQVRPRRGRMIVIVTDDTGAAIAGARVVLTSETARIAQTLEASAAGEARFDDLPPGRYHVSASAPGHVTRGHLQLRGAASGVAIELAAGIVFRAPIDLPRTGTISGFTRDENGMPVSTVVRLETLGAAGGRTTLASAGSVHSSRRGEYRFVDLTPDDYLVSVGGDAGAVRRMTPELVRRAEAAAASGAALDLPDLEDPATFSYLAIYFPNALTHLAAAPIAVGPGVHRAGIDIQMQLSPVTVVEGQVLTPSAGDVSYGSVRLRGVGALAGLSYTGQTTAAGHFQFPSVVPGQYTLVASGRRRTQAEAVARLSPASTFWATAEVIAVAGQVTRLDVTLAPGQPVTGRVVFAGAAEPPRRDRRQPTLSLVARGDGLEPGRPAATVTGVIDVDGSLRFESVPPGTYTFAPSRRIFDGWTLESVTAGGLDLIDTPFEITSRTGLADVVATFVDRLASVSGMIVDQAGRPAARYRVLIYPADPAMRGPWSRRIKVGVPDSDGRFRIDDLPPGDYLMAAGATLENDGSLRPADLEAFVPASIPIALARGEAKTRNFRISGGGGDDR
jgi:hypothetical protein